MYNNETEIFGITGYPLGHTFSPLIHNFLFSRYKYNGIYLVFENKKPDMKFIKALRQLGVRGLSVTIPHKEWAYRTGEIRDRISTEMKASNTVLFGEKTAVYNTDGPGAVEAIRFMHKNFFSDKGKKDILILGSGGSARGIAFALLDENLGGRKILISSRNKKTGSDIVRKLNKNRDKISSYIPLSEVSSLKNVELVIQTTPLGMKGQNGELLLPPAWFTPDHIIFDIVYNPVRTPLVKAALKKGSKIIPGYEMLIFQAMRQFELFTGIKPGPKEIHHVREMITSRLV